MGRIATTDELNEYLENGLCPYCYAEDVVDDGSEWDGTTLKKFKYCSKCELKWTEIYTMTGLDLTDAD